VVLLLEAQNYQFERGQKGALLGRCPLWNNKARIRENGQDAVNKGTLEYWVIKELRQLPAFGL
jgi:hypothetical protein